MDPEMIGAGARGAVGLAYCWEIVWPFVQLWIFYVVARRIGRFLNTVEARIISIDDRLTRVEEQGLKQRVPKKSSSARPLPPVSGESARDAELRRLADESDRDE